MESYSIFGSEEIWKVCTGLLLIVIWLAINLPIVSGVIWKVKLSIFYYLLRKYISYIKIFEINSFTTIKHIKLKEKHHKLIFNFGLFFFSSFKKYWHCESESPCFGNSIAIPNGDSKVVWLNWFLNLLFTSFSLTKKRYAYATLSEKIINK